MWQVKKNLDSIFETKVCIDEVINPPKTRPDSAGGAKEKSGSVNPIITI